MLKTPDYVALPFGDSRGIVHIKAMVMEMQKNVNI